MRFLVDENVSRSVMRWLRNQQYDVLDIESAGLPGASDDDILQTALAQDRIVVTYDKDFGHILTYPRRDHGGVLLIRLRHPTPDNTCQALQRALPSIANIRWRGQVVVIEETRIRISKRSE